MAAARLVGIGGDLPLPSLLVLLASSTSKDTTWSRQLLEHDDGDSQLLDCDSSPEKKSDARSSRDDLFRRRLSERLMILAEIVVQTNCVSIVGALVSDGASQTGQSGASLEILVLEGGFQRGVFLS